MKFTVNWLRDFLDTNADLTAICDTLTRIGLEVESVIDRGAELSDFIVAEIRDAQPHPDADKLQVCTVFDGENERQIVCGAPNARAGVKVVLATPGVIIPNGNFKIKPSKIRGVDSDGMLCSAAEIGLGEDSAGIMELPSSCTAGKRFAQETGLDDPIIDIAITPNRGDCLGVYGIARDLAAAGLGSLNALPDAPEQGVGACPINVVVEENTACTAFAGCVISSIDNSGVTPETIRNRLEAIGASIISPAVDVTNYMLYTFGRPLHVFDADKIDGGIIVRQAQENENIRLLGQEDDEATCLLDDGVTIVSDSNCVAHGIAGIKGGQAAATLSDTKNIFLEVAMFTPERIARTGRKLNIHSDSRYRFERYVDPEFALQGLRIAAKHIVDICGGTVSLPVIEGDFSTENREVRCDSHAVKQLTAIDVSEEETSAILTRLGFVPTDEGMYRIPSWRPDVTGTQDAIEEVARIAGYDRITEAPMPPADTLFPAVLPVQTRLEQRMARVLAGAGLSETICWSFVSERQSIHFTDVTVPKLANSISSEWLYMRPSLLPGILDTLGKNYARRLSDTGLFETGNIYHGITPDKQFRTVAGARIGDKIRPNAHGTARPVDVFDAKADLFLCLEEAGVNVANVEVRAEGPEELHPYRKGTVYLGKQKLGYFGEIHPDILENHYSIKQTKVVVFELWLAPLAAMQKPFKAKQPPVLSDLQASDRDFCFIVDEDIAAGELLKTIANSDKKLVEEVTLFDVYHGDGVPEGKKSLALRVRIRPAAQVLTDADLQAFSDKVIKAAEKRCGAVLRA